jgi:hypothetical protein
MVNKDKNELFFLPNNFKKIKRNPGKSLERRLAQTWSGR